MGIYQLRYLERVPPHAAVAEIGRAGEARAQDVRRRASSMPCCARSNRDPVAWPSREIELSCPEWLLARWERHYGARGRRRRSRAPRCASRKSTRAAAASRISGRSPSCRCSIWRRAVVPRPLRGARATRPRRRSNRACAPSPATFTSTASRELKALGAGPGGAGRHPAAALRAAASTASWWTRPAPAPARWGAIPRSNGGLRPEDLADLQRRQTALLRNALRGARAGRTAGLLHLLAGTRGERRRGRRRSPGDRTMRAFRAATPGTVSSPL